MFYAVCAPVVLFVCSPCLQVATGVMRTRLLVFENLDDNLEGLSCKENVGAKNTLGVFC